jgi:hypothetical protein
MYQLPSLHQSSQCFLLTTFDLKPTAAAEGMLDGLSGMLSRSEYRPTRMIADSSGSVRFIVGNCSEGRPARGSWCGIKRIDGRCFTAGEPSAPFSCGSTFGVTGIAGVEAGVGPVLLRTVSWGAAVSARFLVMLAGDAGGEPLDDSWICELESVCLLEGGAGRTAALVEEAAKAGEAGGVWVEARGRDGLRSSRESSVAPLECRCRFLRKLRPRRPEGLGEAGLGGRAVAATVGAAGAGAVNITERGRRQGCPGRPQARQRLV